MNKVVREFSNSQIGMKITTAPHESELSNESTSDFTHWFSSTNGNSSALAVSASFRFEISGTWLIRTDSHIRLQRTKYDNIKTIGRKSRTSTASSFLRAQVRHSPTIGLANHQSI